MTKKRLWIMKLNLFLISFFILYSCSFILSEIENNNTESLNTVYAQSIDFSSSCDTQHWDKVIFNITNMNLAQKVGLPINTELDIKVLDDPTKVMDVKQRILDFLNVRDKNAYNQINVIDVEYGITCISDDPRIIPKEPPVTIPLHVPKAPVNEPIQSSIILNIIGFGGKVTENVSPVDIVFAIDSSSSMEDNDPDNLRIDSASSVVNLLNSSWARAGVVSWDSNIDSTLALTSDFDAVLGEIQKVDTAGGNTDLGVGLEGAVQVLDDSSRASSSKIIIYLSDGETSVDDPVDINQVIQNAADKKYKIFSIGLSFEAGEADLRKMASATGGKFYVSPVAADLNEIFNNIFTTIIQSTAPENVNLILTPNDNKDVFIIQKSFNINPTQINKKQGNGQQQQLLEMHWQNISQHVGNRDGTLDGDETFSLTFNTRAMVEKSTNKQINIPLINGDGSSSVNYISPNSNLKSILIPQISIDTNNNQRISKDIQLIP